MIMDKYLDLYSEQNEMLSGNRQPVRVHTKRLQTT